MSTTKKYIPKRNVNKYYSLQYLNQFSFWCTIASLSRYTIEKFI